MKLRSVQVLRAVAVLLVVLHHYGSIEVGKAGVDLFFVISGFIMVHVVRGKAPIAFLRARFSRIIPTYYAATLLLLVLPGTAFAVRPLIDSMLLIPGRPLYLPQAWTLIFEFMFYFGCAAYLAWGKRAFLLIPICMLVERVAHTPFTGMVASPLFLEFVFGCAVAIAPRRWALPALAVAIGSFAILYRFDVDRAWQFGIPSAFLLHAAISAEDRFQGWAVPVLIGDASYSIYLTHWTFLALLPPWPMPGYWLFNGYLAVLLGLLFYWAVERPLVKLPGSIGRWRTARRYRIECSKSSCP